MNRNRFGMSRDQHGNAANYLKVVPRFSSPETYEENVARQVNPHLDEYTHIVIVDSDMDVPEEFYQLPDRYPDADIIVPKVIPSSRVYRVWEALTYWIRLNRFRVRGSATIYRTEFLKSVGGYPRVPAPDTWLYQKATKTVQDPMRAYHRESFSILHSLRKQVLNGRARAEMGQSAWRVAAHSIARLRPLVLFSYFYYRSRPKK